MSYALKGGFNMKATHVCQLPQKQQKRIRKQIQAYYKEQGIHDYDIEEVFNEKIADVMDLLKYMEDK
jgi:hypothetical protein